MFCRALDRRVLGTIWIGVVCVSTVHAETQQRKREQADELIGEALHREIYGLPDRQRLLAESLKLAPDYPQARWQNGYVRYFSRWVSAESVPQIEQLQDRLALYERQRADTPRTADGWLALANWCAKNGFRPQEQAHLSQVLQHAPDHLEARRRLGFRRVGGMWVEGAALWSKAEETNEAQADLRTWFPRLQKLARQLRSRDKTRRAEAEQEFRAIRDVRAVPALERLAGDNKQQARLVAQVLGQMQVYQASLALARMGIFLPWPDIRSEAALQLRQHPADNYIPALLAEMATPVATRLQCIERNGLLLHRQIFVREVQSQTQTAVMDTLFQPEFVVLGNGDVADVALEAGFADLMRRAFRTTADRELQRRAQNELIAGVNHRICHILQTATGKQVAPDPRAWWAWWEQVNHVQRLGAKRDNLQYRQLTRSYYVPVYTSQAQDSTTQTEGEERAAQSAPQRARGIWFTTAQGNKIFIPEPENVSCFVAGTSIPTARGRMNIESIVPGDLVLSQDVNSGELSYKPVLQTTRRPPAPVVAVQLAGAQLEATTGHPFWVNGTGWTFAHELKSGMVLHGADGAVRVSDVLAGSDQPAYNLVVAEFHTYFVGDCKVLVHDNTARRPTNASVPGLLETAP